MYRRCCCRLAKVCSVGLLVFGSLLPGSAQNMPVDKAKEDLQEAITLSVSSVASPYFSGTSYRMPKSEFTGDPWLLPNLLPGSLHWVGTQYEVNAIRYDLVLDQLTILIPGPTRDALISLSPLLVDQFSIDGRRFFMPQYLPSGEVPSALSQGYHERVFQGKHASFLVKHRKELLSESRSYTIEYLFETKSSRYAWIDGEYHKFKGKSALLKAMKKYKKEIKSLMKDRKILVGRATLEELVPLFELYESLSAGE